MLTIEGLVKVFEPDRAERRKGQKTEAHRAVDEVSFALEEGEMFTLLGPSGCGKTTTLRSVAGLERPDSGLIRVGERTMFSRGMAQSDVLVPANQRGLGMVFQSYAIWPHMTVFENVAYPMTVLPRRKRPRRDVIAAQVGRVLDKMELGKFAERKATKLSGGQQQRLALARALVTEPPLLLLDEPLSNLDAKLRESLRIELKRLQRELGITSVYVTHDQIEALALSSRVAVMNSGRIMQVGTPREIYTNPTSRFVAEFIGTSNFVPGKVVGSGAGETVVETAFGSLSAESGELVAKGTEVVVSFRPESVRLAAASKQRESGRNTVTGTVAARSYLGDTVDHVVEVGGIELRQRGNPAQSLEPGTQVVLTIDPAGVKVIPAGD